MICLPQRVNVPALKYSGTDSQGNVSVDVLSKPAVETNPQSSWRMDALRYTLSAATDSKHTPWGCNELNH